MAFHTGDPKLQAIEQRNRRLRAEAFTSVLRGLRRAFTRSTAGRRRRRAARWR